MQIVKSIIYWVVFIAAMVFIFKGCHITFSSPSLLWQEFSLPALSPALVLLFGFSLAFAWVEVLKIGVIKPFNCLKCMSGWLTMIVALLFHAPAWYMFLPAGLLIGALFDAIKMRWL